MIRPGGISFRIAGLIVAVVLAVAGGLVAWSASSGRVTGGTNIATTVPVRGATETVTGEPAVYGDPFGDSGRGGRLVPGATVMVLTPSYMSVDEVLVEVIGNGPHAGQGRLAAVHAVEWVSPGQLRPTGKITNVPLPVTIRQLKDRSASVAIAPGLPTQALSSGALLGVIGAWSPVPGAVLMFIYVLSNPGSAKPGDQARPEVIGWLQDAGSPSDFCTRRCA